MSREQTPTIKLDWFVERRGFFLLRENHIGVVEECMGMMKVGALGFKGNGRSLRRSPIPWRRQYYIYKRQLSQWRIRLGLRPT